MDYKSFFNQELQKFKDQGFFRQFKEINRPINKFPKADENSDDVTRDVEVWCTNDYLNMSQHPEVVNETVKTVGCKKESKKGCTGKSVKCITHNLWDDLENHINSFFERNTLKDIIFKATKDKRDTLHQ